MPYYTYVCETCGAKDTRYAKIAERDAAVGSGCLNTGCAGILIRPPEMPGFTSSESLGRIKMRQQLRDEIIHRRPGFDHQHDAARPREALREFRDAAAADETLPLPASVQKFVHFRDSAIIAGDCKPFAFHVQNEVFPHHG